VRGPRRVDGDVPGYVAPSRAARVRRRFAAGGLVWERTYSPVGRRTILKRSKMCSASTTAGRIASIVFAILPLIAASCAPDELAPATATGGTDGGSTPAKSDGSVASTDVLGTGGATGSGIGGAGIDAGGGVDSGAGGGTDAGSGGSGPGGRAGAGGSGGAPRGATGGGAGRQTVGGATGGAGAGGVVTVFIASDSTASNYPPNAANMQAGWGQMLPMSFDSRVRISNQAIGGRTSRRFVNEGRLTTILNAMKAGDYLLVQFGTNDGNMDATYPDGEPYFVNTTDFESYMGMYIDGARAKQGIPILVTPPPRASCSGDSHSFGNGLAGYSAAMKTVATQKAAALIDLNAGTLAYVNMLGCVAAKASFYLLNDGTHFQQNGARIMAGIVADGIVDLGLPLAAYRLP
jgi:lysophospholipase L1-like esterase